MLGKDYFVDGLTVEKLGLRGVTPEEVKALIN
jgi:hypothetical protein